jgi:hypothetical protein
MEAKLYATLGSSLAVLFLVLPEPNQGGKLRSIGRSKRAKHSAVTGNGHWLLIFFLNKHAGAQNSGRVPWQLIFFDTRTRKTGLSGHDHPSDGSPGQRILIMLPRSDFL